MNFFQQIGTGIKTYAEAHRFIRKHKLFRFVFIPGLINLILFTIYATLMWIYSGDLIDFLSDNLGLNDTTDREWLGFLQSVAAFLINLLIRLMLLLIYIFIYKYLVLITMSPILAYLSEMVEKINSGSDYPFKWKDFLSDSWRGIVLAAKNAMIELIIIVICYLIALIPVVGIAIPVVLFMVESYFVGFSMFDYYLERQRIKASESSSVMRKHSGLAISNGAVFLGLLFIPILGILVAPTYAVVAATLAAEKTNSLQLKEQNHA